MTEYRSKLGDLIVEHGPFQRDGPLTEGVDR